MYAPQNMEPFFPGGKIGVLLLHGLAGTPADMILVGKLLNKDYGFSVFCPPLAANGLSGLSFREEWLKGAARSLDALIELTESVFVGGISAGAILALKLARLYPDKVRGLALYSTVLNRTNQNLRRIKFLLKNKFSLHPHGVRPCASITCADKFCRSRFDGAMPPGNTPGEFQRLAAEVKKELPYIHTPTLIIHSRNDGTASLKNAIYVREHLGGPTEMLLLWNSCHLVTLGLEYRRVCAATGSFFRSQISFEERSALVGFVSAN